MSSIYLTCSYCFNGSFSPCGYCRNGIDEFGSLDSLFNESREREFEKAPNVLAWGEM